MLHYFFQVYFIFVLCSFIQVNYRVAQEDAAREAASFSDTEGTGNCTQENCTCADIPKWNEVVCFHVNESSFPVLHFKRVQYLPERLFLGVRLHDIGLLDQDATVADNVLEGILGLDRFLVIRSSIQVVPDFSFVKDSIKVVLIRSSLLTSLEGKHLQNLPFVRAFSFRNNSIRYIDPDIFLGTDNVKGLDLSDNKLTSIPPNLLNSMMSLVTFNASHNYLLHVDNLFSVKPPEWILLAFNNITHFNWPQDAKNPGWDFYRVWKLDLTNNFIRETNLSLSTCEKRYDFLPKIGNLTLNGNKLRSLNECLKCIHYNQLEVIGNQIQFLTERNFVSVIVLRLVLRQNQIRRIDTDAFKPFNRFLHKLDLSYNKITSTNGSIRYLSNLVMVNLSYNSIQTFAEKEFTDLPLLQALYLEHNQIKSLETTALPKLEMLEVLNIAHNDMKFIKLNQVPSTLKDIYLADNPLKCDCKNLPFIDKLKDDKEKGMCLRPELENSTRKHLNCPDVCSCECTEIGDSFSMFVNCSSRNLSLTPHFMENDLPQLEVNEMSSSDEWRYRVLYQNVDSSLHLEGDVLGISLENNRLDNLDAAQLPPNLVQLYLSNNQLRRFPQSVIDTQLNLKQVSLSGNPWKCDCDALEFKRWLTSNDHIIMDFYNVRCGKNDKEGRNLSETPIWTLKDDDICPATDAVMISSVSSISFVIFCLFAKRMYRAYELDIKVSLYSHGFAFVKKADDHDKAFDAFISFAHRDDEFVIKDIISEIENRDPNIRLCLHYRHFRPGVPIIDNIKHAVQKSKRTVLILSNNFLESEWCILEFKTAQIQTLLDKAHRIIAVKIGELPKDIDPSIKIYLESTTYLTWGDRNFWNKLLYILPSRSSDTSPVLRFVGDNETVFNFSSSDHNQTDS